ncbi:uncharacterized protein LOC126664244 isoform X2 [Mercurialis annua]|uniref:uncharacterized protein LOC126664244 isoform X2 n=1 Tax=Mercurialis annua TaxID=3986 RepID=UPI00215E841B|nr:uncharacterized protein LOC126664244 isoform X2 [Mercurialis annua]
MEEMREIIEETLKFTLNSQINQTLEFDLCLSTEFCSNLLRDDPNDSVSLPPTDIAAGSFEGVREYPLFKCVASALYQSIISGSFCKTYNKIDFVSEDISLKQKEEQWSKSILEKGTELINVLNSIFCELHVQEPYFSLLKDGIKTIEGRCAGGNYSRIEPGALILINKSVVLKVKEVHQYPSFLEMLKAESLSEVLPGVKTIEEGVKIYWKFYSEEKEMSNGVLAICVSKVPSQPYLFLASILSELGYTGIQSLLGIAHTVGTASNALPPSKSTLISSFTLPYRPNRTHSFGGVSDPRPGITKVNHLLPSYIAVEFDIQVNGSTLTQGARALAKHSERSSSKYWGVVDGNDSTKNMLALNVINGLIASCCWSNVHIAPQHGTVFEIRVADGYGARWSQDGSKFIGFLEPYMEDGFAKGYKH